MLDPVQPREIYVQLEYCLVILSPFLHQEGSFGNHLGKINTEILQSKMRAIAAKVFAWKKKKKKKKSVQM